MTMDVSVHGAIAGVVMVLATIAGLELAVINVEAPYLVFLPGVIAAFFVGGALTSAVAIGIAAVVTWYFLTPPVWSFALPSWQHAITFVLFLAIMVLVCRILAVQRRRIDELASANISLRNQLIKAGVADALV
jgi:K+-sensing histidine kinase KdpD